MLKAVTVPIREIVRTRAEIKSFKIQNGQFRPDIVTVPIREIVRTRAETKSFKIQNGQFRPDIRREFTFINKLDSSNF